jgi:hypothetical protein
MLRKLGMTCSANKRELWRVFSSGWLPVCNTQNTWPTRSVRISSSATRMGGLYNAMELPITQIADREVRRASVAAIRLGDGIKP